MVEVRLELHLPTGTWKDGCGIAGGTLMDRSTNMRINMDIRRHAASKNLKNNSFTHGTRES